MNSDQVFVIRNNLPRVQAAIRRAGINTLRNAADRILREAKRNIVVFDAIDTGNMLNSGYIRTNTLDGWPSTVEFPGLRLPPPKGELDIQVNFAASYSVWVHDGTAFVTARPFLNNAVETVQPHLKTMFQRSLRVEGI